MSPTRRDGSPGRRSGRSMDLLPTTEVSTSVGRHSSGFESVVYSDYSPSPVGFRSSIGANS